MHALRPAADWFQRHPRIALALLLGLPLGWMVVVYLGSLGALLVQSFWSLDDYTGQVVRSFSLEFLRATVLARQPRHRPPQRRHGHRRHPRRSGAGLPAGVLHDLPRQPARAPAVVPRGGDPAVVELPGARVRVEADPGQGRHAVVVRRAPGPRWRAAGRARPARHRRPQPLAVLDRDLPRLPLRVAAVHDPAAAGRARARAAQPAGRLRRPRRRARPDLPPRRAAAGPARRGGRLDLHLLADAGRLRRAQRARAIPATSSARQCSCTRAPRAISRWPPRSPWCRC